MFQLAHWNLYFRKGLLHNPGSLWEPWGAEELGVREAHR